MKEIEFVDLGLPSGTLWAKHNVCAHKRRHFTHSQAMEIARDLHCKLPLKENFEELINLCKWKWMKLFGKVARYKVTGPSGKSIFLSASGYDGTTLIYSGISGYYWSADFYSNFNVYCLYFDSSSKYMNYYSRYCGRSVCLTKHVIRYKKELKYA